MATGLRPFNGETNVAVLSSILKDTPPSVTDLNGTLPSELGRIIKHCLVKDPARRYQTAVSPPMGAAWPTRRSQRQRAFRRSRLIPWPPGLPGRLARCAGDPDTCLTWPFRQMAAGWPTTPGRARSISGSIGPMAPPSGSSRMTRLTDRNPTFSPDGQWIAFMSNRGGTSQIWLIRPDGSGVRQSTQAPNGALSYNKWSPDGSRLFYWDDSNMFVFEPHKPWREQTLQALSRVIEAGLIFDPFSWSRDGKQLLGNGGPGEQFGVFAYSLASRRVTRLSDVGSAWTWLNDGRRLLFTYRGGLFVLDSVSKKSRELLSVTEQVRSKVAARGTLQSKTRSFSTLEKAAAHETSRIASKLAKGYERTPRVSR
jgi:serine/threonine protein kinase